MTSPKKNVATKATRKDLPFEDSIAAISRSIFRQFTKSLEFRVAKENITLGMFLYLRIMNEHDGITQGEISRILGIRGPTASKVIEVLEQRGWVLRVRSQEDKRRATLFLTKVGGELRQRLIQYAIEVQDLALEGVPEKDYEVYFRMTETMLDNLKLDHEKHGLL